MPKSYLTSINVILQVNSVYGLLLAKLLGERNEPYIQCCVDKFSKKNLNIKSVCLSVCLSVYT